nr:uncharacterized protein LOC115844745 [Globicephala melas]
MEPMPTRRAVTRVRRLAASAAGAAAGAGGHRCMGGSVVEFSPATREARVRFPAHADAASPFGARSPKAELGFPAATLKAPVLQQLAHHRTFPAPVLPTQTPPPHTHPGARPPGPDTSRAEPLFRPDPSLSLFSS